ncbi:MAG: methyltransferase domain-containing protein [bacterium]
MPNKINNNIHYKSKLLVDYYSKNRVTWNSLYDSEKKLIEQLPLNDSSKVLDLGCACGGLIKALNEHYNISDVTGVDINPDMIEYAQQNVPFGFFKCQDILTLNEKEYRAPFVFSLSCIDFNVEAIGMFYKAWHLVSENGYLILSVRLSAHKSLLDMNEAFQYIVFNEEEFNQSMDKHKYEKAAYVVFNISELISLVNSLDTVGDILSYGYWGKPSFSAVLPYKKLVFAVIAVKKEKNKIEVTRDMLNLPDDL